MDLAQLRAFVAIADAGGVSHAANLIHLSQPALSRQLQALEALLGIELFMRERRRLRLTSAGEELLIRSRAILQDSDALMERARALQSGETGTLKLGATPPMIETLLGPFLRKWREQHPGVEVHLVEDGGSSLAEKLDHGEMHLAYVPAGDARFDCLPLYPVHVVAAVAANHALARKRSLELADIAGHPLLVLRTGFGSRDWFDLACRTASVNPTILLESSSHNAVLALVTANYGVGILPSAVAAGQTDVVLIPMIRDGVPIGRWTMLAWSKRRYLPLYARGFVTEFGAFARKNYPGRDLLRRAPKIDPPRA